jgi:hypothetical protein
MHKYLISCALGRGDSPWNPQRMKKIKEILGVKRIQMIDFIV